MKILITGGAGFIGTNLCKRLLKEGHNVVSLDNFYSSSRDNMEVLCDDHENFEFVEHNVINSFPKSLTTIKFDQIYHLACPASPVSYQKDHIYTIRTNFEGTLNVLEFAHAQQGSGSPPTVLFASTSEVYGDPTVHPQQEPYCGNVNPHGIRSCYDEGKRAAESLCMNFWRDYGLPVRIVRIFNTYGPYMDPNDGRVVSNFIIQSLKGDPLTIYGDGRQTRSFQYVDDLVGGMCRYMNLVEDFPGPVNLGNPNEFTILDLAELMKKLIDPDLEFVHKDLPQDDPLQRCPDISLAMKKLGWKPTVELSEGLEKTIKYFQGEI